MTQALKSSVGNRGLLLSSGSCLTCAGADARRHSAHARDRVIAGGRRQLSFVVMPFPFVALTHLRPLFLRARPNSAPSTAVGWPVRKRSALRTAPPLPVAQSRCPAPRRNPAAETSTPFR